MWRWPQRGNQRVLSLAGAAVAVAAWTVFTYFEQGSRGDALPRVQADHGVAAGGRSKAARSRSRAARTAGPRRNSRWQAPGAGT